MFKKVFAALVLGMLATTAVYAVVPAAGTIELKKVTGTIRIMTPAGKVITVSPGDRMPVIPAGSTISVLSGRAEVMVAGARVFLNENQGLTVNQDPVTGAMQLASAPGSTGNIQTQVGGSNLSLSPDSSVALRQNNDGTTSVSLMSGSASVVNPDGSTTPLGQGSSFVALPQPPSGGDNGFNPEKKNNIEDASPLAPKRR